MSAQSADKQLNMHLADKPSGLTDKLQKGEFTVMLETPLPVSREPFDAAVENARTLMATARGEDAIGGIVLTDATRPGATHDPIQVSEALREAADSPLILTLSGKALSRERFRELSIRADSAGVLGLFCVTGDKSEAHPAGDSPGKRPKGGRPTYLDSVEMIARLHDPERKNFLLGGAVNPFKYTAEDQYLQFYKALRKLNTGADYLVTQIGWDMKKLQALQWYLQMREISVPVIARIALLSMEEINHIHEGYLPGVPIPRSFGAMMQREANISFNQSLSAQLHRIGLQAAGCKLLGYSGVQIRGIRSDQTAGIVITHIKEALQTYTSYTDWLAAWEEYHSNMQFTPVQQAFYTFRDLLSPEQRMYDNRQCTVREDSFGDASAGDRWRAGMYRFVDKHRVPEKLAKTVIRCLCRNCENATSCRPQYCEYLCPKECPKELMYGPCGNSSATGICEFGGDTCFFHRVLKLASHWKELDSLESGINLD